MELLGNNVRVHLGLGTPQHTLPAREKNLDTALALISYGRLPHRSGDNDSLGF